MRCKVYKTAVRKDIKKKGERMNIRIYKKLKYFTAGSRKIRSFILRMNEKGKLAMKMKDSK